MFSKRVQIALAIIERNGTVLLLQRRDRNPLWDKKWEFPGGKVERGEDPVQTVHREVLEETGLTLEQANFLFIHHHNWLLDTHTLHVEIHCFHAVSGEGDAVIEPEKAYQSQWVSFEEAQEYDSLEANADLLKKYVSHVGRD